MTFASGGESDVPACGPPASWPAVQSLWRGLSTNPGGDNVVQLKKWCVSCVWMLQRGHSDDGCVLASTLCKYDLRKGDLFVLSWIRVWRVRRRSLSSELLVCGGGVHSILLLPLVARCLETIDVCMQMLDHLQYPSNYEVFFRKKMWLRKTDRNFFRGTSNRLVHIHASFISMIFECITMFKNKISIAYICGDYNIDL